MIGKYGSFEKTISNINCPKIAKIFRVSYPDEKRLMINALFAQHNIIQPDKENFIISRNELKNSCRSQIKLIREIDQKIIKISKAIKDNDKTYSLSDLKYWQHQRNTYVEELKYVLDEYDFLMDVVIAEYRDKF